MASIMCPTPVRQLWLYRPTGPDASTSRGGWEVGFFDATGDLCPESVHVEPGPAADRVHWLNGGDTVADADGEGVRLVHLAGLGHTFHLAITAGHYIHYLRIEALARLASNHIHGFIQR